MSNIPNKKIFPNSTETDMKPSTSKKVSDDNLYNIVPKKVRRLWGTATQEQLDIAEKYKRKVSPNTQNYLDQLDWITWKYNDKRENLDIANALAEQRARDAAQDAILKEEIKKAINKVDLDDDDLFEIVMPSTSKDVNYIKSKKIVTKSIPKNDNIKSNISGINAKDNARQRFRNFIYKINKEHFLNNQIEIQQILETCAKFFIACEFQNTESNQSIECFITFKNNLSSSAAMKTLKIQEIKGISRSDIEFNVDRMLRQYQNMTTGFKYKMGFRQRVEDSCFWSTVLDSSTVNEGLELVESERPLDYIRLGSKITSVLTNKLGKATHANFNENWKLPFFNWDDGKTKVFIGPSGIGKTNFALSHFQNPAHVTIRQDFEKMGPNKFDYDGCVVDDLPLYSWMAEEVINLTDSRYETAINVKYATGFIPVGTKIIICCNAMDDFINKNWNQGRKVAIQNRCHFYLFPEALLYNVETGDDNMMKPIISKFDMNLEEHFTQSFE